MTLVDQDQQTCDAILEIARLIVESAEETIANRSNGISLTAQLSASVS
jgi:hypothetical protein